MAQEVDVLAKLDRNNLQYTEALMAMAETLLERLNADGHALDEDALKPVRDWFVTAIQTRPTTRELSAELKTGVQAGGGIPWPGQAVREVHGRVQNRRQPEERMAAGDSQRLHHAGGGVQQPDPHGRERAGTCRARRTCAVPG